MHAVVARGEAEIGFQQISELLEVPGIDYVGPLPADAQRVTVFSAGVAAGAAHPDAARVKLSSFFVRGGPKRCFYQYDFGDDWWHEVRLLERTASDYNGAWRMEEILRVRSGGMTPRVYLLRRL